MTLGTNVTDQLLAAFNERVEADQERSAADIEAEYQYQRRERLEADVEEALFPLVDAINAPRGEATERYRQLAMRGSFEVAKSLHDANLFTDVSLVELAEVVGNEFEVTGLEDYVDHFDADPDLATFLASDDPPYEWVIPRLLEVGDRCIITGPEGGGKSTLLRQIAVQASSGIHTVTGEDIEPVRVLLIDCENSARQVRRKIRPLHDVAGGRYRPDMLRMRVLGHALDLADPAIFNDIARRAEMYGSQLICLGPLYKMTEGDPIKEEPARALADALDCLRSVSGAALLIEAHTPYADGSKARRPLRPYGASLWSRWPEFGVHMTPDGVVEHWRGQRDERDWPAAFERSMPWPWMVDADAPAKTEAEKWHGPTQCMAAIELWLDGHPDEEVSKRKMADKLRGGGITFRNQTVSDALEALAAQGRIRYRKGPNNADLFRSNTGQDGADPLEF